MRALATISIGIVLTAYFIGLGVIAAQETVSVVRVMVGG